MQGRTEDQRIHPRPALVQESKFFEESFQVYERGIALFKWPHVSDIWQAYLSQFVERYKGTKLERARDLYKQALGTVSPNLPLPTQPWPSESRGASYRKLSMPMLTHLTKWGGEGGGELSVAPHVDCSLLARK